mmetsp:Transcript_30666/g.74709  ORF Transcript_30666/g.74709 Transcript_30666/m.74709 type:complete len:297 (-) Transcript_30666:470-1360(-)
MRAEPRSMANNSRFAPNNRNARWSRSSALVERSAEIKTPIPAQAIGTDEAGLLITPDTKSSLELGSLRAGVIRGTDGRTDFDLASDELSFVSSPLSSTGILFSASPRVVFLLWGHHLFRFFYCRFENPTHLFTSNCCHRVNLVRIFFDEFRNCCQAHGGIVCYLIHKPQRQGSVGIHSSDVGCFAAISSSTDRFKYPASVDEVCANKSACLRRISMWSGNCNDINRSILLFIDFGNVAEVSSPHRPGGLKTHVHEFPFTFASFHLFDHPSGMELFIPEGHALEVGDDLRGGCSSNV